MRRRVQLIVLVAVLGVGAGLGVVAIRTVRARAVQVNCRNAFRQLALAFEIYHDVNERFPPGTIRNPDLPVERRLSWTVDIWAYAEAHMIAHARTQPWDGEGNRAIAGPTPRPFRCPANPEEQNAEGVGLAHVVGIAGLGTDAARLPVAHLRGGVFAYDRGTRRRDIKDGTETTLLALETTAALGPWLAGGPSTVRGLDPGSPPYLGTTGQFGSHHQTIHGCFADGSVRALRPEISPDVFEALATIAGKEELSPPWE